jgi:hypothetical protein
MTAHDVSNSSALAQAANSVTVTNLRHDSRETRFLNQFLNGRTAKTDNHPSD